MPLSYTTYQADGNTKQFAVPFGYLRRSHVFVFVDGTMTGFKWASPTNIEIDPEPVSGASVKVQRMTDKINRITDFADGQTLLAGDLDAATLQNFYLVQEMIDGIVDGVLEGDVVITNPPLPGDPVSAQQIQEMLNEAARNSPVIEQLLNDTSVNSAAIVQETQDRIAALSAETSARVAAIADEALARNNALQAEADARIAQIAGIQSQLDADVANLTQLSNDLTTEVNARIADVAALNDAVTQEATDRQAAVQANADALAQEVLDRQGADTALQTNIDAVVASVGDNAALIASEQTARINGDSALATQLDVVSAAANRVRTFRQASAPTTLMEVGDLWFDTDDGNKAYRFDGTSWLPTDDTRIATALAQVATETTARIDGDNALSSQITSLTATVGQNTSDIVLVNEAVTNEASARATAISGLQTQVDANFASIATNSTAISNETSARVSAISALQTQVDNNASAITTEATARSDADTAFASDLTALTARVGTNEAGLITVNTAIANETSARATAISGLQTQVDSANAAIASNATAISNETSARASSVNTLTASIGSVEQRLIPPGVGHVGVQGSLDLIPNTSTGGSPNAGEISYPDGFLEMPDVGRLSFSGGAVNTPFEAGTLPTYGRFYILATSQDVQARFPSATSGFGTPGRPFFAAEYDPSTGDWWAVPNAYSQRVQFTPTEDDVLVAIIEGSGSGFDRIQSLVGNLGPTDAAITAEQSVRSSADSALASDISAITTRMGDAEADIVSNATAITDEAGARATETRGLRAAINSSASALTLNFGQGFEDWFGGTVEGDPEGSLPSVTQFGTYTNANHGPLAFATVTGVSKRLSHRGVFRNDDSKRYRIKVEHRVTGTNNFGTSLAQLVVARLDSSFNLQSDAIKQNVQFPAQYAWVHTEIEVQGDFSPAPWLRFEYRIPASASHNGNVEIRSVEITEVNSVAKDIEAQVVSEASARASADSAIASDVAGLTTRMGDAEADIVSANTAISTESSARATAIDGVVAQLQSRSGGRVSLDDGPDVFTPSAGGAPHVGSPVTTHWDLDTDPDEGYVLRLQPEDQAFRELHSRAVFSTSQGKRLRLRLRIRVIEDATNGGGTDIGLRLRGLDENFNSTSFYYGVATRANLTVADGWQELTSEHFFGGASAHFVRASVYVNWKGSLSTTGNARYEISELDVEEIADTVARITTESDARASADAAIASDVTGLQTRMGDAEADIVSNATAISDEAGARATEVSLLRAYQSNELKSVGDFSAYTTTLDGAPEAMPDLPAHWTDPDAGAGPLIIIDGLNLATKGITKPVSGRRYKVVVRWRFTSTAPADNSGAIRLGFRAMYGNDYTYKTNRWLAVPYDANTSWRTSEVEVVAGSGMEDELWRPFFWRSDGGSNPRAHNMSVSSFYVQDVTDAYERQQDVEAQVTSETSARASADSAIASDVTGLTTRMGDAEADIVSNSTAISNETSARTSEFSSLRASLTGGSGNILENSQFIDVDGSVPEGFNAAGPLSPVVFNYRDLNSVYTLDDPYSKTLSLEGQGATTGAYKDIYQSNRIACAPGERFIASAYTGAHRCNTRSYLFFYDSSGGWLGTGTDTYTVHNAGVSLGGNSLEDFKRVSYAATAPANAHEMRWVVRMDTISGQSPLMVVTRPMLEKASADQNLPSPWGPGNGEVTADSFVAKEAAARASADIAQASDISSLTTRMGDAEADIVSNSTAISDETSARATEVKQLSARFGAASATFPALLGHGEFTSQTAGDPATVADLPAADWPYGQESFGAYFYRRGDAGLKYLHTKALVPLVGGKRYRLRVVARYRGSVAGNTDPAHISIFFRTSNSTHAYIRAQGFKSVKFETGGFARETFETSFVAPNDEAWGRPGLYTRNDCTLTDFIDIISIDVEEESASITEIRDAFADANGDVNALYSLRLDVNGNVSGFGLSNNGSTSEFAILADKFLVSDPGSPGSSPQGVFLIENGNVVINSARIGNAAIGSAQIDNLAVKSFHLDFANLRDATINTAWISTAQIKDAAITNAKIGNASISSAKIQDGQITNAKIGNAAITNAKIGDAAVDTLKIAGKSVTSSDFGKWANAGGPWTPREFINNQSYQPWLVNKFEVPITGVLEPGREVMIAYDYDIWHQGQLCEYMAFWEKLYLVPTTTNITSTAATVGLVRSRIQEVTAFDGSYGNRMSTELRDAKPRAALPRNGSSIVVMPADADTVAYKAVFVWHLDRNTIPYSNGNQYGMKNWQIGSTNTWGLEDLEVHALHFKR